MSLSLHAQDAGVVAAQRCARRCGRAALRTPVAPAHDAYDNTSGGRGHCPGLAPCVRLLCRALRTCDAAHTAVWFQHQGGFPGHRQGLIGRRPCVPKQRLVKSATRKPRHLVQTPAQPHMQDSVSACAGQPSSVQRDMRPSSLGKQNRWRVMQVRHIVAAGESELSSHLHSSKLAQQRGTQVAFRQANFSNNSMAGLATDELVTHATYMAE